MTDVKQMHGLINTTIQSFVVDTYGIGLWRQVVLEAGLGFNDFEAMLQYPADLTDKVLNALEALLALPRSVLLEDIGTYLVSGAHSERFRRLLRFGGVDFVEFLRSLDELPDRARLAVDDLSLPRLELREHAPDRFSLLIYSLQSGFGSVMLGLLRAMADDYGVLVFLEYQQSRVCETIDIQIIEAAFAAGRSFDLALRAG